MSLDNAILVTSKEKYINYITWFTKTHPNEDLNLRLSHKKLSTRSNREQYIMLFRKYHPWINKINEFILRMEQSGILAAWGDPPFKVDISINPKFLKATENINEKSLHLRALIPMFLLLCMGLTTSILVFALETYYENSLSRICFLDQKLIDRSKWTISYLLCIIAIIILSWLFFYEESFPANIAFVRWTKKRGFMHFLSMMGMSQDGELESKGVQVLWK